MDQKYFNDAIIGNQKLTASFSKKGELLRLLYPTADYMQYVDYFHTGVKINDSQLIKLHDDINNQYEQTYIENTNILNTEIVNTYFNLKVVQTDFVPIDKNILIKRYKFINQSSIDLKVNFLIHSKLLRNQNNFVGSTLINKGILQYSHDYTVAIFSTNRNKNSFQLNNTSNNIESGYIYDKDYIGMASDSSISFDLETIKPLEIVSVDICVYPNLVKGKFSLDSIKKETASIQKLDIDELYLDTKNYWKEYVKKHYKIQLNGDSEYIKKIEDIYKRTILLFPLLTNRETGGIQAAIEIDENLTKCGRYAYCWPRDAVFMTKALDILKMYDDTEKFYNKFCKMTQSESGMWEQRFYTDGNLAPCWGYQIDETASVIYGIYDHYVRTKRMEFVVDNFDMLEKASNFLIKYVDYVLEDNGKMHVSYDLWEMNEGVHLYSLSSIYSAFDAMTHMYRIVNCKFKQVYANKKLTKKQQKELEKYIAKEEEIKSLRKEKSRLLKEYMRKIKEYTLNNLVNKDSNFLVRNTNDRKMDVSIIGSVVPFNMFDINDEDDRKIINSTVDKINSVLRTNRSAYYRFEDDNYMNCNPWIISSLWMALYYSEIKNFENAKECFKFAVDSATELSLLPEQIDNNTMQFRWVIGLGWSHAMFVLVLDKLKEML